MSLPLQKFREIFFLLLYSHDFVQDEAQEENEAELITLVMRELSVAKRYVLEAHTQLQLLIDKLDAIDLLITGASSSYDFSRIPHIERNILRLGIYELLYVPGLPPKVAIAEAVRLARKFASPESSSFINAILDNIYQDKVKEEHEPAIAGSVRAE